MTNRNGNVGDAYRLILEVIAALLLGDQALAQKKRQDLMKSLKDEKKTMAEVLGRSLTEKVLEAMANVKTVADATGSPKSEKPPTKMSESTFRPARSDQAKVLLPTLESDPAIDSLVKVEIEGTSVHPETKDTVIHFNMLIDKTRIGPYVTFGKVADEILDRLSFQPDTLFIVKRIVRTDVAGHRPKAIILPA